MGERSNWKTSNRRRVEVGVRNKEVGINTNLSDHCLRVKQLIVLPSQARYVVNHILQMSVLTKQGGKDSTNLMRVACMDSIEKALCNP